MHNIQIQWINIYKTVLKTDDAFKDNIYCKSWPFSSTLTKRLHSFSLLAAELTADVVKSEEDVMFLMHVDRQLNLNLSTEEQLTLKLGKLGA